MLRIESGQRLLFMGDSITSCMRESVAPPLGAGFVQFTHCFLAAKHPEVEVETLNCGVDGETIRDLSVRWESDVIDQKPDWLFVMIGVNDVLYRHRVGADDNSHRAIDDEEYRETYQRLCVLTREALPDCRIVLMDPTPLEEHLPAESHGSMRALSAIVAETATAFGCEHIPVFERFYSAVEKAPTRGWMIDVPHPRLEGQSVIALAVLEHLGW